MLEYGFCFHLRASIFLFEEEIRSILLFFMPDGCEYVFLIPQEIFELLEDSRWHPMDQWNSRVPPTAR